MADFCMQCSAETFGFTDGRNDFLSNNIGPGEIGFVLCETCGWIIIDADGRCIDEECPEHGHGERG